MGNTTICKLQKNKIRDKIIDFLKRITLFFGFGFSKSTSPGKLAFLFNKTRPVNTNHPPISIRGNDDGGYLVPEMDIDWGEYDLLMETSCETLKRFRIIIFEFHDVDRFFDPARYQLIAAAFYKLLKDFGVVHIHPNKFSKVPKKGPYEIPPLLEFTFLRKDRINQTSYSTTFPNALCRVNVKEKPDFKLSEYFYKQAAA